MSTRVDSPTNIAQVNKEISKQVSAVRKELKTLRVFAKQVHEALTTVRGQQVLQNQSGALPVSGNFTVNTSGPVMMFVSGSGFNAGTGLFTMNISVDGTLRGSTTEFTNESTSHKALPTTFLLLDLTAGSHTVTLSAGANMSTDTNDHFNVAIIEMQ